MAEDRSPGLSIYDQPSHLHTNAKVQGAVAFRDHRFSCIRNHSGGDRDRFSRRFP
jgi:hypothetical protein